MVFDLANAPPPVTNGCPIASPQAPHLPCATAQPSQPSWLHATWGRVCPCTHGEYIPSSLTDVLHRQSASSARRPTPEHCHRRHYVTFLHSMRCLCAWTTRPTPSTPPRYVHAMSLLAAVDHDLDHRQAMAAAHDFIAANGLNPVIGPVATHCLHCNAKLEARLVKSTKEWRYKLFEPGQRMDVVKRTCPGYLRLQNFPTSISAQPSCSARPGYARRVAGWRSLACQGVFRHRWHAARSGAALRGVHAQPC